MGGSDIRRLNPRRRAQRDSRSTKYGFLVVSVWSFLSIVSPGHIEGLQPSLRRTSQQTTRFLSSRTEDDMWAQRNARRRIADHQGGKRRQKTKPMPLTGYDAQAIEKYYDRRPLQVGWRLNSLSFPLLGKCCFHSWKE